MPRRQGILSTGEFYHVYNRSLSRKDVFHSPTDFEIFLLGTEYYLQCRPPMKFSNYREAYNLTSVQFDEDKLADILAFVLMPNHYHFLLKQNVEGGIATFMQRLMSSYVHYYNRKYRKVGPLCNGAFKSKHLDSRDLVLHESRYIHINPTTSRLVKKPTDYPYSSLKEYFDEDSEEFPWVNTEVILNEVQGRKNYRKFVLSNIEYQIKLKQIGHDLEYSKSDPGSEIL